MRLYSENFDNMTMMPKQFTADGENISPSFHIEEVPEDAVSLTLLCHDPDATRGTPWIHWVVWDLSPDVKEISDNNLASKAVSGITSFGATGYGGPSPSPGTGPHRYVFTLYAMNSAPQLNGLSTYEEIVNEISKHMIASANWTGLYERV